MCIYYSAWRYEMVISHHPCITVCSTVPRASLRCIQNMYCDVQTSEADIVHPQELSILNGDRVYSDANCILFVLLRFSG